MIFVIPPTWSVHRSIVDLPIPEGLRSACVRFAEHGEARYYGEAHLVARWCLGLLSPAPVACQHCAVLDTKADFHAALDWENLPADRRRTDDRGRVYSTRPDLDYIALCRSCHRSHDMGGWKRAS